MSGEERLDKIIQIFEIEGGVQIVTPFSVTQNREIYGKIEVSIGIHILSFDVYIEPIYPIKNHIAESIRFYFTQERGLTHQNYDGSICIHTKSSFELEEKLANDIRKLKEWIQKYYINREEDPHYDYLLTDSDGRIKLLYTFDNIDIKKGDCGIFTFSRITKVSNQPSGEIYLIKTLLPSNFGETPNVFYSRNLQYHKAIWIYLKDEPVLKNRDIVKTWNQLSTYVSDKNIQLIHSVQNNSKFFTNNSQWTFLCLGYDTPDKIHWQPIILSKTIQYTSSYKLDSQWKARLTTEKICWADGVDSSYERFFGKGMLHESIRNKRIAIIGIGAIGSILAETLVRGGARHIGIFDYDYVMPDNVCRSKYNFIDAGHLKIAALGERLQDISPFVEILGLHTYNSFGKFPIDSKEFIKQKKFLNKFDIIINCSAENEITGLIESMELGGKIFDVSISNGAKHLTCVTGNSLSEVIDLLNKSKNEEDVDLYHPNGCFNPTFRASFNDINLLVTYATKHINNRLENSFPIDSFKLSVIESHNRFEIKYEAV